MADNTIIGNTQLTADTNPLLISSSHTGFSNNATNQAEITNDTTNFKTLMIVGNRSAGMGPGLGRRVSVWDRLEVNGDLQVTGSTFLSGLQPAPAGCACVAVVVEHGTGKLYSMG